jgi:hypothetical protein
MAAVSPRPRWVFLLQPKWLCWHAFAVAATAGMLWLGDWQLHRALSGNELSWAYTFEWPLFAIFGVYFWARTIRDELRLAAGPGGAPPTGAAAGTPAAAAARTTGAGTAGPGTAGAAGEGAAQDEAESAEAYLARLQAAVRGHGKWHGIR